MKGDLLIYRMVSFDKLKRAYEIKSCITAMERELGELKKREALEYGGRDAADFSRERIMLENNLSRMNTDIEDAVTFIENCSDITINQAMYHRFLKGKKWDAVACALGGYNSADGIRKMVERYLDKMGVDRKKN